MFNSKHDEIPPYWTQEEVWHDLLTASRAAELGEQTLDEVRRVAPVLEVSGEFPEGGDGELEYWAARPADFRASYHGSGLPFANPEQAYDRTPNQGIVPIESGKFRFEIALPNSFYLQQGRHLLTPHVLLRRKGDGLDAIQVLPLGQGIPHRSLTHLPGNYPRSRNYTQKFPAVHTN